MSFKVNKINLKELQC